MNGSSSSLVSGRAEDGGDLPPFRISRKTSYKILYLETGLDGCPAQSSQRGYCCNGRKDMPS
jgi:hypothetical protein